MNNSSSWSIRFEANTKTNTFKIDYGSLSCGGILELKEFEKNRAVFIEKITDGKDKCINGNTIIITFVSDNYLSYTCFAPGNVKLDASATLENLSFSTKTFVTGHSMSFSLEKRVIVISLFVY
ncbi:MAG: hypothetical protein HC831_20235 [Chloroflexia bacterium]|nr:hypothetical protein [Chloroflexia bacterium]